jgi:hypothetical protein
MAEPGLDLRALHNSQEPLQPGWVRCFAINWASGEHRVTDAQAENLKIDAQAFVQALAEDRVPFEKRSQMLTHMIADALAELAEDSGAQITALSTALQIIEPKIAEQMGGMLPVYMAVITDGRVLQFAGSDNPDEFGDSLATLAQRMKRSGLQ